MLLYCLGAVALYALTPVMLLFERLYGGGPPRRAGAGWIGTGRLLLIGASVGMILYDLARGVLSGHW
jgi:hypothetical protein